MKKLLPLFLVLLIVAFTVPALAQTTGYNSSLQLTENIAFDYHLWKYKLIAEAQISADLYFTFICKTYNPDSRASAQVFKKQVNQGNVYEPWFVTNQDLIVDSFTGYKGIGQANQAAGPMNNQGNVVNAAVTSKQNAYASAEVTDVQFNDGLCYDPEKDPFSSFNDKIERSFNRFEGVGQVNQSAGFANNQNNVVNVAFSTNGAMVATSDVQLEQVNVKNVVISSFICTTNTAKESFNGFTGVGQMNQSAGNFNNQANIVSFAGTR